MYRSYKFLKCIKYKVQRRIQKFQQYMLVDLPLKIKSILDFFFKSYGHFQMKHLYISIKFGWPFIFFKQQLTALKKSF